MDNKEQSLDRIKLLMKYSVGNTLSENITVLQGKLLKEDSMGAERMINAHNREVLGADWDKQVDRDPRKKIISIPSMGGAQNPIKVVEGTQYNLFTDSDNSGNLFPGRQLKKDPKYGWYEIKDNVKVFYPEDSFWKQLASVGALKSFKTGPTVSNENGEKYHFLINLDEEGWPYATIGYKQSVNKSSRGWKLQPWYYKTDGDKQEPYDESNIDTRNEFDKFWDEYGVYVQLVGGLLIGAVTAGVGNLITASILANAGIVAAEGAIIASEVATVVNAVNVGRRYAFALEVLLEGGSNIALGMYEKGRGEDPTLSFIFASLPFIKVLPGFNKVFGKLNYTVEDSEKVLEALDNFDGTNPHIFDALPKRSKEIFEEVIKASKNNPEEFKNFFKESLEIQAANASKNKELSKTFIDKTVRLGQGTGKFIKHMSKEAGKDITLAGGLFAGTKGVNWAWQKLYAAYEDKYNSPMPKEEIKKVNNEVKKLPTEEEKIKYIEDLAQSISSSEKNLNVVSTGISKEVVNNVNKDAEGYDEFEEFLNSEPVKTSPKIDTTQNPFGGTEGGN
jgi:hypothetical protein